MTEKGKTIQKGVPRPDNPVEIINIYKDINFAVKIVEKIRNKVTLVNVPEHNKEYKIPFLNDEERQAVTTVLYKLSEQDTEINKLKNVIDRMAEVLNDFDYDKQCENCMTDICSASVDGTEYTQCIKEFFMKEDK